MKVYFFTFLGVLFFCCNISAFCFCDDEQDSSEREQKARSTSEAARKRLPTRGMITPYCGVHAVYIAAKHFGKEVELEEVIRPQYIRFAARQFGR
jgi:hypothetical protein